MKIQVFISLALSLGSLALASTQAQATACSQLGHWSWPPEFDAKEFGASIGNHEGVRLKYYTDLNDFSKVVQVSRSGFVDTTTYEHRSNTSSIYVTTRGSIQDSYTVDKNDSRYLATLTRMRDLIGYIGAPESYFRPNGGPDSLNVQTIYLVKYLDQIIESLGKAPSNCVLYKDVAAPLSENACHLTGGALFTLGAWNENIKAVWVRSGYRLTLIDDDNFSKAGGLVSYSGDESFGTELDGGRLISLQDAAGLDASTALCVSTQP